MGYWKVNKEKDLSEVKYEPKETVKDIMEYPFKDIPERKIRKETLEKFGVRVAVDTADGVTPIAVYFPSYDQKENIVGYKKQDLTKHKSEKGHWTTVGNVVLSNKMFGQNVAENNPRKRGNITTFEGEWDCLSCYQAMKDQVRGTKYEDLDPFVVSISMGTANAVESILHNIEFNKSFESFTIFFDNDEATPKEKEKGIMKGFEAREAVANALIGTGLSMFVLTAKEGCKDASDMLQQDKAEALAKMVQFDKRPYSAEKIVHANEITFEEVIAKPCEGVVIESFPKLMDKIKSFRKRELTLLCSGSGTGKSTVTSIIAADMIAANQRVGLIFLEETKVQTLQRMVAHKLKVNYNNFKADPTGVAVVEDIKKAYDEIVNEDLAVFLDHFGNLPVTEFMSKIKHMHLVDKCDYIIVDHLTLIASGSGTDVDERKLLDQTMTELAAFCAANDVGILAISHINRSAFADNKPPKDSDEKPYWTKVDKSHMRGSAALEQLSWNIIGLESQIMPDRSRGSVRIVVLKNRTHSFLGICDEFRLNPETWQVELQDDVEF